MLGLGVLAASKALGQTDWIVQYREAFRQSVGPVREGHRPEPDDPRFHHALALSLRYLGQTEAAAEAARPRRRAAPGETAYRERAQAFDQAAPARGRARAGAAAQTA